MKKLIVHIGPPKTATTSLQYYFQNLDLVNLFYAGVSQPRQSSDSSIAAILLQWMRDDSSSVSLEQVLSVLNIAFAENDVVIVSEELFLVPESRCSLSSKMDKLMQLSHNYDTRIIYTKRNLKSVVPSYYQELYPNLTKGLQDSFEKFCKSTYMEAFDLLSLKSSFQNVGCDFKVLDFEDVVSSRLRLFDITAIELHKEVLIRVEKENKARIIDSSRVLRKKSSFEQVIACLMKYKPKSMKSSKAAKLLRSVNEKLRVSTKADTLEIPEAILTDLQLRYDLH